VISLNISGVDDRIDWGSQGLVLLDLIEKNSLDLSFLGQRQFGLSQYLNFENFVA
jgi:hypothetical protein